MHTVDKFNTSKRRPMPGSGRHVNALKCMNIVPVDKVSPVSIVLQQRVAIFVIQSNFVYSSFILVLIQWK